MSALKVINLGLPKSGTTTLGEALKRAGLKVADWKIHQGQSEDPEIIHDFVGRLMYRAYYGCGDPLALMHEFDAFTEISMVARGFNEWPQTDYGLISAIQRHHPGAKFLLSARSPADIVNSMRNWSNMGKRRLPMYAVPGLPEGYGKKPEELERWVAAHSAFCRKIFEGSDVFLEYNPADPEAPKKIGEFLGIELPWWGRANVKQERVADKLAEGKKP